MIGVTKHAGVTAVHAQTMLQENARVYTYRSTAQQFYGKLQKPTP